MKSVPTLSTEYSIANKSQLTLDYIIILLVHYSKSYNRPRTPLYKP
jgi:hypothetical protein